MFTYKYQVTWVLNWPLTGSARHSFWLKLRSGDIYSSYLCDVFPVTVSVQTHWDTTG